MSCSAVVVAIAGFTVYRVRGMFGSDNEIASAGAGLAANANIVAQGDSDTIGCRITVADVVKDEKSSDGVHAETFCLVKPA